MRDAQARLAATEKLLAAGPKGPYSLKLYAELLKLPLADARHWIARGLLKPFDLASAATEKDPLSQLYDASAASVSLVREGAAQAQAVVSQQSGQLWHWLPIPTLPPVVRDREVPFIR